MLNILNSLNVVAITFVILVTDEEIISRYFAKMDETFFIYCEEQLTKINTFYSGISI